MTTTIVLAIGMSGAHLDPGFSRKPASRNSGWHGGLTTWSWVATGINPARVGLPTGLAKDKIAATRRTVSFVGSTQRALRPRKVSFMGKLSRFGTRSHGTLPVGCR